MTDRPVPTETEVLLGKLRAQRHHVLSILEGLSDADLRGSLLPTGWAPIEVIKHLAFDIEYFWFRGVVAGEAIRMNETEDEMWRVAADVPLQTVLDWYRTEAAHADEIIAARSPNDPVAWWPLDLFPPDFRYHTVREVIVHVIAETATHAGHLDIVRELIDGKTWLILT